MGETARGNIILTGFSYTGKSVIAKEVAKRLGWRLVDTDDLIVKVTGKPIPEIFAQDGEKWFRELERQVLEKACAGERVVIASGGGAIVDARNRELMTRNGVVVCLEAAPKTIYQRLLADSEGTADTGVRPLLLGPGPEERITKLKESRQPYYAMADWTVHTDSLTIEEVCVEVVRGWRYGARRLSQRDAHSPVTPACVVTTATESYPVFVGWGLLDELGERMHQAGLGGNAIIISDDQVFSIYGSRVERVLSKAGFSVGSLTVPLGEGTKSFDTVIKIYDWLVERRVERGHIIVALGGGMIGDLVGFVAATFLRGLPFVQVPTSLLAMVDASIGGKVAVNHPQGKNLVGAFYQPRLVLADIETLTTLPGRELTSGWAELIKHAMILDAELFGFLEANAERLLKLEREPTVEAVTRSVRLKAMIVGRDEKEMGERIILNYGHTIAHGLEAATGYQRFLHGEAVAIGMTGEAMISQRLGLVGGEVVERQRNLLERFGLATVCPGANLGGVLMAMELDKKVTGEAVRWVLLAGIGKTVIRQDVPQEDVVAVLEQLIKGG